MMEKYQAPTKVRDFLGSGNVQEFELYVNQCLNKISEPVFFENLDAFLNRYEGSEKKFLTGACPDSLQKRLQNKPDSYFAKSSDLSSEIQPDHF